MPRITTILTAFLALVLPATAQDAPVRPVLHIVPAAEARLEDYLWVARPVVVFADAPQDPRFIEQIELLAEDAGALDERDVVVITDTDPAAKNSVRTDLRPRGFMLALIAKDGSVVFRKPLPWDVREITHAIDKLPLRKQELSKARTVTD